MKCFQSTDASQVRQNLCWTGIFYLKQNDHVKPEQKRTVEDAGGNQFKISSERTAGSA